MQTSLVEKREEEAGEQACHNDNEGNFNDNNDNDNDDDTLRGSQVDGAARATTTAKMREYVDKGCLLHHTCIWVKKRNRHG